MKDQNPKTAQQLDALCKCETPEAEVGAVTDLLKEVEGMPCGRDDLLATIHHAIYERSWQFRDAEEDGEDEQDAEEIRAMAVGETTGLLVLLKLVQAAYPPTENQRLN